MAIFNTPLRKRRNSSRWFKKRYADPAFRLAWINKNRAASGLPLLTSLEGVSRKATANRRPRDEKGRFL